MTSIKILMKMPQLKLASKCIALEELLQRYYQFEAVHYDLQSKYELLREKFDRINKQLTQDQELTQQSTNKKLDSYMNCTERIEIVDELETKCLIEELQNQNQKLVQELQKSKITYQNLQNKYEQNQADLMRSGSVKTASDSKYYSVDEKCNESIQSYKSEIARLNKMVRQQIYQVSSLRLELSQFKTRQFDEEWLKAQLLKYQKQSQFSNNVNSSFNVFDS